jgi:hypothetical protein
MKKTWKIGESCQGGIITVEIVGSKICIIGKEWDYSKGSNRGSNQSNAKEFTRGEILSYEDNCYRKLYDFINGLATSYWAGEIVKWIETKIDIKK